MMKFISDSNEDEMVLAFLKAEIESPRFQRYVNSGLTNLGYERTIIIDNADLKNHEHNQIRIQLLEFRGYKSRTALFAGFPSDVKWTRIRLGYKEFSKLKYAKYPTWIDLSQGSRLVVDGASNIDRVKVQENDHVINDSVKDVAKELDNGKKYPELIGVENEEGQIVLVEGHTRATAYAIARPKSGVEIIVGNSPRVTNWAFY